MVRSLKGEGMGTRDKLVLPGGVSSINARSFSEVGRELARIITGFRLKRG